ncbi:MAG: molybdopterin synthase sulfur carrier subunit [SAR202 cluster bacterium Io17-Chloro-G3]|nr:MAG: molybdopterin synthase sulfur carrier subunit [SAR202 cluster bacterium Io17-Chloro-G3]
MAVVVRIPGPLRKLSNGDSQTEVEEGTLRQTIELLETRYPGIKERLVDESGDLRYFVNVYLNGEDVRFLQDMDTTTSAGDELSIVPAVAGGYH